MTTKVYVESDFIFDGIKIAVVLRQSVDSAQVMIWTTAVQEVDRAEAAMVPDDAFLRLPDDTARALYEALSAHYGGNVVDATRLRKDYDAERGRVDAFIRHLTVGAS
jgi:hypothetical protein